MDITGIKIIRNQVFAPVVSKTKGAVDLAPGETIDLTYGDALRVGVSLEYKGPGEDVTLYGSIGVRGLTGFDEKVAGENALPLPTSMESYTPTTGAVDIPITADINADEGYDLYVKIKEYPSQAGRPEIDDIINITGTSPKFELLEEITYSYAYVYDGPTEATAFTFTSLPFTPTSWQEKYFTSLVEQEVKKQGGRVLSMKIYVDKSALLWTNWRIEVEGVAPSTTGVGMEIGIAWWAIAILAALAIALVVVLTWSIKTIISSFTHKAISEEVKAAWSRETLISCIHDFEDKLERSQTPTEELEKKTDQELRDYCDELAEEVAPGLPGSALGLALAAVGVLAIAGVGAYALTRSKKSSK